MAFDGEVLFEQRLQEAACSRPARGRASRRLPTVAERRSAVSGDARVDDRRPPASGSGKLEGEGAVVLHVLEHVHDHHPVELGVREGQPRALHQCTSSHRSRMDVTDSWVISADAQSPPGAGGGSHHPVVGPQVEAPQPAVAPACRSPRVALLEDGAAEERSAPPCQPTARPEDHREPSAAGEAQASRPASSLRAARLARARCMAMGKKNSGRRPWAGSRSRQATPRPRRGRRRKAGCRLPPSSGREQRARAAFTLRA